MENKLINDFLKQNTDIANEPREEITDTDLAVGLAEHGFHVYLDDTDRQLTFETVYNYFDAYGRLKDGHTFSVPMMEVAQYGALESLCENLDSLNDDFRADRADIGMSLEDYAKELFDNEESQFMWGSSQSEWENIRRGILLGETKFLHNFLDDTMLFYPSRAAELLEDLNHYEETYLKGQEHMENNLGESVKITVSGWVNTFDVTSVGFDTEKEYTVSEFNQALKAANEKWQENWDGLSYPKNIIVVKVENLHNDPCTYRINLTDADYNSIQDIVELSPTPMHASIPTDEAIEKLNKAEANTRERGIDTAKQDKTFAYEIGHSAPFTVIHLDVSTEERKNAVSKALKTIINSFGERNAMSQPYKNLLEDIKPTTDFLHASQGHLSALKYALRNSETNKELCLSMLDSIKHSENNLTPVVIIKGYDCIPKDAWEEHGVKFTIGQSVDDMSFYYARATDGKITRDYEYDYEPDREKVISDHADKLAEEDIDCGEAIYGSDGYLTFPDTEMKPPVENIPLSAREDSKEQKGFEYNGYHFEPIGKIDSESTLKEIGKAIVSNKDTLDMSVYQGSRLPYSYVGFYAAANESEADVFRCIENGKSYLPGENELFEYTGKIISLTKEKQAEHIPPQQDISHKTNSAELSAAKANGQKRSITMSNNTKLSVSSMTILGENSSAKAYATVTINDEFAIRNVKVFEGKNGPFASMPSRKIGGEYQDVVFPITKEAREQFNAAVIDCYNEMQKSGEVHFMHENTPPEKPISTITASVHLNEVESNVKATGQIVIDNSFVVSGVCVIAGKDNLFASMPSYTNDTDERKDFAFPITKECYEKVQGAVLNDYNYIQNYHEMGGKENLTTAYDLHPKFADRLSAELNKNGITNIVKVKDDTANISVKIADKERFTEIRKELAQSLKQAKQERDGGKKSLSERIDKAREQQPEKTAEQPKQPQPHRKPNQAEL